MTLVDVDLYAWAKRAFETHHLVEYRNRYKFGLTKREGDNRVLVRVEEQDVTAVDEPLLIKRSWSVQVPEAFAEKFDDYVRDIMYELGATEARLDKKREFAIVPGNTEQERFAFMDAAVDVAVKRVAGLLRAFTLRQISLRPQNQQPAFDANKDETLSWFQQSVGAGKTYTALSLLEYHRNHTNPDAVLVPGIELANQIALDLAMNTTCNRSVDELCITLIHSGSPNGLAELFRRRVVPCQGPTTNPEDVTNILLQHPDRWHVFVGVYDSVDVVAEGIFNAGKRVNTKYIDEIHRTATIGVNKYSRPLYLKCCRQYGGTATQRNVRI